ncbi:DUF1127 domain-containing protein [Agarivorans sp. Z349TD_8]|uniref:DUF1127 domain-containing protein n=1 Tax=Agarivorans sp. Z349TD_8 TaxID=3421434 RepID=UPI003D7DEDE9
MRLLFQVRLLAHRLQQTLAAYQMLARSRRALAKLSDDQLADIGVSRVQAQREADRFFWQRTKSRPKVNLQRPAPVATSHKSVSLGL